MASRQVACSYYGTAGVPGSYGSCHFSKDPASGELGMTFAELNNGTALGGLACGTYISVSYQGHTITVRKADIGLGGPGLNGKPRAIDLFITAANALNFPLAQGVILVTYQVVSGRGRGTSNPQAKNRPSAGAGSGNVGNSLLNKLFGNYESALDKRQPWDWGGP